MKITLNKDKTERKVVALVNSMGQLILPNRDNCSYTISNSHAKCFEGSLAFVELVENAEEKYKIYEGDSITIQF